jgi:hypothetical protein
MRFDEDPLEFEEPVEVKRYRDGGWHWEMGRVVDPTATPVVIEMADGQHIQPKGGRVRRARRSR